MFRTRCSSQHPVRYPEPYAVGGTRYYTKPILLLGPDIMKTWCPIQLRFRDASQSARSWNSYRTFRSLVIPDHFLTGTSSFPPEHTNEFLHAHRARQANYTPSLLWQRNTRRHPHPNPRTSAVLRRRKPRDNITLRSMSAHNPSTGAQQRDTSTTRSLVSGALYGIFPEFYHTDRDTDRDTNSTPWYGTTDSSNGS